MSLPAPMYSVRDNPTSWDWIAPFGNLRINACLRLPEAYRSLPRPSSPVDTKAFIMCSCSLTTNIRHGLGRPPYIRCQSIIVIPLLKPHRRLRRSAFQPCSLLPYVVVKELRLGPGRLRGGTSTKWWAYLELNQRPRPYQRRALTS